MGYEPLLKTQKCHLSFLPSPPSLLFRQSSKSEMVKEYKSILPHPLSGYPLCLKQIKKLPPTPPPPLSLWAIQIGAFKLYETLLNEGVRFRTILSQLRISFSLLFIIPGSTLHLPLHSMHRLINSSSKTPPPISCQALPLKFANGPSPLFRQSSIYISFSWTPPS